jgi:hypothetical protein
MIFIFTIKKNKETLIDNSKEVGLEMNVQKIWYILLSRHQNSGQNRDMQIVNRSFENVSQFKLFLSRKFRTVIKEHFFFAGYESFTYPL